MVDAKIAKIVEFVIEKSKKTKFIDNILLIENCSNGENIDKKNKKISNLMDLNHKFTINF